MAGTLALLWRSRCSSTFGNPSVERLFKYVSLLLYGVYVLFVLLALSASSATGSARLRAAAPTTGWALGGLTYASYNIVGAVVILPVMRHLTSRRDAIVAGLIAGPLAMLPALLFFTRMVAFYPGDRAARRLPSDFLLQQLAFPAFHLLSS